MPFYDAFTELRRDKWGGRGLFAKRKILKGEVVESDSFGDWSEGEEEGWRVLHLSDLNNFPNEYAVLLFIQSHCLNPLFDKLCCTLLYCRQRNFILAYSMSTDLDGHIFTPLEMRYAISAGNFINHSCNGNLWYAEDSDALIARRDIEAGVLITSS